MQLIKIVNVPIEYKMQIEHARLEMQDVAKAPSADVNTQNPQLKMRHTDIKMRQDSSAMFDSIGLKSPSSFMRSVAQKANADAQQNIAQIVTDGNIMAQKDATINDVVANHLFADSENPQTVTTYLPTTGPAISWQPNSLSVDYQPGTVTFDWNVLQGTMKYIPGDVKMEILQYPSVEIEYIGGPTYVPPSADPNYVAPADE